MAAHGARRLMRMLDNLAVILGVEGMCAAQGIEARAPLVTSTRLTEALKTFRAHVPALGQDRYMATDLTAAADLIASDHMARATNLDFTL